MLDNMKTILTTVCLLIASMTASYADGGRYQTTNLTSAGYNNRTWVITDTVAGKFRFCSQVSNGGILCQPWFDVQKDDWMPKSTENKN